MTIDVLALEKSELIALNKQIDAALVKMDALNLAKARAAAEAAVAEYGLTLADILAAPGGTKGMAKYANPKDPSQTWTGRGRKPNWVLESLEAGMDLDDLSI